MKSCDDKVDSCVRYGLEYYMIFTLSSIRTQLAGNFQITFPDIKVKCPLASHEIDGNDAT